MLIEYTSPGFLFLSTLATAAVIDSVLRLSKKIIPKRKKRSSSPVPFKSLKIHESERYSVHFNMRRDQPQYWIVDKAKIDKVTIVSEKPEQFTDSIIKNIISNDIKNS